MYRVFFDRIIMTGRLRTFHQKQGEKIKREIKKKKRSGVVGGWAIGPTLQSTYPEISKLDLPVATKSRPLVIQ